MEKTLININEFADGALQEKFNRELQKVLENIMDPNTAWKTGRKITIDIKFTTDEERELSQVSITAKSTLAARKEATTKLLIDMDGKGGYLANELKSATKGQMRMRVDEETGEIINQETNKDADFEGIKLVK